MIKQGVIQACGVMQRVISYGRIEAVQCSRAILERVECLGIRSVTRGAGGTRAEAVPRAVARLAHFRGVAGPEAPVFPGSGLLACTAQDCGAKGRRT